jgi:hypothetical protein
LFRGAELPRLLTMIVMLGVLVLLIGLARDTATWRWLAPETSQPDDVEPRIAPAKNDEAPTPGPADEDPQERDAARVEFQAVTDKVPLSREEMPAYWRLMTWEQRQSTAEMLKRARADVTYNELWQRPEKWRGRLLRIRVHVPQAIKVDEVAENPLGLKTIYEVFGWNSDSQPYSYWMVTPELPSGMPLGKRIQEEATFVGYFLKLQPFQDGEGKSRAAPLLLGRIIWHPAAAGPVASGKDWTWTWYLAGVLVMLIAARWGLAIFGRAPARGGLSNGPARSDPQQVEAWLNGAQSPSDRGLGNGYDRDAAGYRPGPSETAGPPSAGG